MKKKMNIKTVIRKIVREEVAMAIGDVINELKIPNQQVSTSQPKKKIVEKKQYSTNSILNEVLNETNGFGEYPDMDNKVYDSSKMNEIVGSAYGNQKLTGDQMVASMGADPNRVDNATKNALTRDYSDVMKAIDKKKNGGPLGG